MSQQDEKSQIKNKAKAMKVLRSRLYEMEMQRQHDEISTVDVVLEPVEMDGEVARVRARFEQGDYDGAVDAGRQTAATLQLWLRDGLDVDEPFAAVQAILGQSLYELDRFDESVQALYQAIVLGEEIVLPINHRHGGGGFREGFCRGFLTLSLEEVAFRSADDPDHGFAVPPGRLSGVEVSGRVSGRTFRLDTEVQEPGGRRRNVDFVHPDAQRIQRDPDSSLVVELACPRCDASFEVHAALLQRLSQS